VANSVYFVLKPQKEYFFRRLAEDGEKPLPPREDRISQSVKIVLKSIQIEKMVRIDSIMVLSNLMLLRTWKSLILLIQDATNSKKKLALKSEILVQSQKGTLQNKFHQEN